MTSVPVLLIRDLAVRYGPRDVFHGLSVSLDAGQALGVIGHNGAGKTTLLRTIVGLLTPHEGEVRIQDVDAKDAARRTPIAYFGGDVTLPGAVRAAAWGSLGTGTQVTRERRKIRCLSRGSRQLLGLRTVLGRHPLSLIVLDEPWEALDPDTSRWLTVTLEAKRDKRAALVLASDRLQDLAGLCDSYVFLTGGQPTVFTAQEIASVGPVTAALLTEVFDRLRSGPSSLRVAS